MDPRSNAAKPDGSEEGRIEEDIVVLIRTPNIQDAAVNLGEAGLDQLVDAGFLRDVPVLGSAVGFIRAAGSIRDLLLAKKLGRFLSQLHQVPLVDREEFVASLVSRHERHRIGEALILLLDRLDDMAKPELLGLCFSAYVRGQIDRSQFDRLAAAIDRLLIVHLSALAAFYTADRQELKDHPVGSDVLQALANCGLVRVEAQTNGGGLIGPEFVDAEITYTRNDLGSVFVGIVHTAIAK